VLDGMIESLTASRVLLLVNYRPEYEHAWGRKTSYSQLRIDPLPPENAEELLNALLGEDRTLEPLQRLLIKRTEGNPFFLEESVRTLIETKVLLGDRGAYRLAKPLDDIQVPATVEAVLAARIDRLPAEDKRLLQVAAVIGQDVPFALLQAVAELPDEALREGLAHLWATEFLYESSLFPDPEYTFKHALTHEVAYRGLLQERRRELHARCLAVLEQLGAEHAAEQVERLAHHAFRAEAWDKAAAYLKQAGNKAIERSAHREAGTCFEQALEALAHLPESRDRLEQAVDLRLDLRNALYPFGESRRILECLREAEEMGTTLDDNQRLGWVSVHLAWEFTRAGEHEQSSERAERALAIAADSGDRRLYAVASFTLGVAHNAVGDYSLATELLQGAVAQFKGELARERCGLASLPSVLSRGILVYTLSERGEFAEGIALGEEAVQIAEAADHLYSLSLACAYVGWVYLVKGDVQKSIPFLERGLHLAQIGSSTDMFLTVPALLAISALGYAYVLSGRIAEALPLLDRCASQDLSEARVVTPARLYQRVSEAYLMADRLEEATRIALRVRYLAQQRRERGRLADALWLLGEIAGRRDPPEMESAEAHYRKVLVGAEALGMRPLQAHCHLGLGKLSRRIGDRAKATEHLTTAARMYREMDMGFWLEKAEAELATPH
jgi:tetratricopeptide (TPR) repeat protein